MGSDVEAKQAITEAIYRYCRALDRMDRELADTVWHPDGTADYGVTYQGAASGLLDQFWSHHAELLGHAHQVTNILIEVDGDRAGSESYAIGSLWDMPEAGPLTRMVTFGRYFDRWSCRDGVWAIDHRRFVYDVVFLSPPDATGHLATLTAQRDPRNTAGRRDRTDPSYEVLGGSPLRTG
jgi:SnoaL-like domain